MVALYIHWPFCELKCPYCDFNSHVREKVAHKAWEKAYLTEINYYADYLQKNPITSIFFGGGTPSLMEPEVLASIISHLRLYAEKNTELEITMEANPSSVEMKKMIHFKAAGINRLSLGIQSLQQEDLLFLGRAHNAQEATKAMDIALHLFTRYSFDFIYGLPNQTVERWEKELANILCYKSSHLSLYQLTIEKGTPFFKLHSQKAFTLPSEKQAYALYTTTHNIMENAGLPAYEISNYAKSGAECRHNLSYWHYDDYLGIGPGAHSRITINGQKYALMAHHLPEKWLSHLEEHHHGTQSKTLLTPKETIEEALLMGLRLTEGLSLEKWKQDFGHSFLSLFPHSILKELEKEGLITITTTHFCATYKGLCVLNALTSRLCQNIF